MTRSTKGGAFLIVIGVVVLAGILIFRTVSPDAGGGTDALAGWPEQVSMTCTACSKQFDLPARQYVSGMASAKSGSTGPFACPACGSRDVGRTENLERSWSRADREGG
jgi:DNA-directed RNA polymerase subunit RPC12/RpoP